MKVKTERRAFERVAYATRSISSHFSVGRNDSHMYAQVAVTSRSYGGPDALGRAALAKVDCSVLRALIGMMDCLV